MKSADLYAAVVPRGIQGNGRLGAAADLAANTPIGGMSKALRAAPSRNMITVVLELEGTSWKRATHRTTSEIRLEVRERTLAWLSALGTIAAITMRMSTARKT